MIPPAELGEFEAFRSLLSGGFEPLYVRQNYLSSADGDTSGTRA